MTVPDGPGRSKTDSEGAQLTVPDRPGPSCFNSRKPKRHAGCILIHMLRHSAVLILLGLALARPVRAQERAERATIDSIRYDYQTVTDSNYLISHERDRIAVARGDRDNPY